MWKRGSKGKVLPLVLQWSLENCSKDLPLLPQSLLASISVCPCYAALHAPPTASVPSSTPMQCMLGTLITPFSIHSLNESKHWAHSSLLFTWLSQDLPRNIPEDFFGYTFLSWWEVSCPSTCPLKLTLHLAHETARSLTNLQESLDFLAKTTPDIRLTLFIYWQNKERFVQLPILSVAHTSIPLSRQKSVLRKFDNKLLGFIRQLTTKTWYERGNWKLVILFVCLDPTRFKKLSGRRFSFFINSFLFIHADLCHILPSASPSSLLL